MDDIHLSDRQDDAFLHVETLMKLPQTMSEHILESASAYSRYNRYVTNKAEM